MAKAVRRRKAESESRKINWWLIGGVAVVAIILLFALLYLSLQEPVVLDLNDYCTENGDNCVVFGPTDATVTVVEVYDYACPACGNFALNVADEVEEAYFDNDEVRWIYFPYSLPQYRQLSVATAAAALCIAEQDDELFQAFHRRMFEIQSSEQAHTREAFDQAAAAIGADVDEFSACLESGRNRNKVEENLDAANLAGIEATPSFYIDGRPYSNIGSFEQIQQLIEPRLPQ